MIPLNQLSQVMRVLFSTKFTKILMALVLSIMLVGCHKTPYGIALGDWISEINDKAGLISTEEVSPYFINIQKDSMYYEPVQNAVSWGILDTIYPFDPETILTKEWTAFTLERLITLDSSNNSKIASDIQNSPFQKEINHVLSLGLMNVDKRNKFYPKEIIDKDEALRLLDVVIEYINDRDIKENKAEVVYKDDLNIKEVNEAEIVDDYLLVENPYKYEVGDVIVNNEDIYEITDINNDEIEIEEKKARDIIDSMDIEGNVDIDFDHVMIEDAEGNLVSDKTNATHEITYMSLNPLTKSINVNGFKITISSNNTGLSVNAYKEFTHGTKLNSSIKLSGINVKYSLKNKKEDIEDAYVKVTSNLSEQFSIKNSYINNKMADFSELDSNDYLKTIQNIFKNKKDVIEATIPLCTITVPVPGTPIIRIKMGLELKVSASGKMEIVFNQNGYFGFEKRNGAYRLIKDYHGEGNTNINASFTASGISKFTIDFIKDSLMDCAIELGAKANANTIIHLYDDEGKKNSINSDLPSDYASEISSYNNRFMACSDIDAHWVGNISLNSSNTFLGSIGLSNTINVIPQNYLNIFPEGKRHFENFIHVPSCTRKDRSKLEEAKDIKVSNKIMLDSYAKVVHIDESKEIKIKGLPEGYTKNDLIYEVEDSSVANIDGKGLLFGLKEGNTKLKIYTSDNKHEVNCNILVTKNI